MKKNKQVSAVIPETRDAIKKQKLQQQKDKAVKEILNIYNHATDVSIDGCGYLVFNDDGQDFVQAVCEHFNIQQTKGNYELIKKMGERFNKLSWWKVDILEKSDLDVGAWDIIEVVLMIVFLPITIIPMVVDVATGSDVCNVQTKMELKSKVGTLLEKRAEKNDIMQR